MRNHKHLSSITIAGEKTYVEEVCECLFRNFHIISRFDREDGEGKITSGLVLGCLPSWILSTEEQLKNAREDLMAATKEKEQMANEIARLKEELGRLPKPRVYDAVLGGNQ